jgi:hypothetical protein
MKTRLISRPQKKPSETACKLEVFHLASGAHDPATGRTILHETFSALGFGGAIFGGGHSAASAFLGHMGIFFY